jgi:hypothetical protein
MVATKIVDADAPVLAGVRFAIIDKTGAYKYLNIQKKRRSPS